MVVNLLPPKHDPAIVASYLSEFMDLVAYQDYRVLNLWEVDASLVLQENWPPLLPFVPVMRGGDDRGSISKALALLRSDDRLADAVGLKMSTSTARRRDTGRPAWTSWCRLP